MNLRTTILDGGRMTPQNPRADTKTGFCQRHHSTAHHRSYFSTLEFRPDVAVFSDNIQFWISTLTLVQIFRILRQEFPCVYLLIAVGLYNKREVEGRAACKDLAPFLPQYFPIGRGGQGHRLLPRSGHHRFPELTKYLLLFKIIHFKLKGKQEVVDNIQPVTERAAKKQWLATFNYWLNDHKTLWKMSKLANIECHWLRSIKIQVDQLPVSYCYCWCQTPSGPWLSQLMVQLAWFPVWCMVSGVWNLPWCMVYGGVQV